LEAVRCHAKSDAEQLLHDRFELDAVVGRKEEYRGSFVAVVGRLVHVGGRLSQDGGRLLPVV